MMFSDEFDKGLLRYPIKDWAHGLRVTRFGLCRRSLQRSNTGPGGARRPARRVLAIAPEPSLHRARGAVSGRATIRGYDFGRRWFAFPVRPLARGERRRNFRW